MLDKKIPIQWLDLALLPIDSPHWKSKDGTEYFYYADKDWIVTNEIIGPYRIRSIAKIIKTIKIKPKI